MLKCLALFLIPMPFAPNISKNVCAWSCICVCVCARGREERVQVELQGM